MEEVTVIAPDSYNVTCLATGVPLPEVTTDFSFGQVSTINNNATAVYTNSLVDVSNSNQTGQYSCKAENSLGKTEQYFTIIVLGIMIITIIIIVIISTIASLQLLPMYQQTWMSI